MEMHGCAFILGGHELLHRQAHKAASSNTWLRTQEMISLWVELFLRSQVLRAHLHVEKMKRVSDRVPPPAEIEETCQCRWHQVWQPPSHQDSLLLKM